MKSFKQYIKNITEETRGSQKGPRKSNAAIHELDKVMPGIYGNNGYMKYGHGDETLDKTSHNIIRMTKDNPDMEIPVYKAVSKGEQSRVKKGDWVTPNLTYARSHGESIGKDHQVISKIAKVKELFSDGTSIHEFGYHPDKVDKPVERKKSTDGIPSAMVSFGNHSLEDDDERIKGKKKKKKLKTFKEAIDDERNINHLDHSSNHHIGETNDDVHKALHSHYDYGALGAEHKRAISNYTDSSNHLNTTLLRAHRQNYELPSTVNNINLDRMDEALSKQSLPHPLTTFSGVKFEPHKTVGENGLLHLPAYTSSSTAVSVAKRFGHTYSDENGRPVSHILRFKLPTGHHGFYVGEHSDSGDEKEFILPRGMTVRLSDKPEVHKAMGRDIHLWDAEPVQGHGPDKKEEFEKSNEHFNRMINSNHGKNVKIAFKHYPEKITADHVDRIIKEGSDDAKSVALEHPSITSQHISHILNNSKDDDTKIKAVSHSKATPEHIDHAINSSIGENSIDVKKAAISNPNASSENLFSAIKNKFPSVRSEALKNKNITPEHIDKALSHSDYETRTEAASHPNASVENINKALEDNKDYVSKAAVNNPNFSEKNLVHALSNSHTYRAAIIKHFDKMTPEFISKLIKNTKDPESKEAEALAMMIVMQHRGINDDHKRQILNHPDDDISGLGSSFYGPGKIQAIKQ